VEIGDQADIVRWLDERLGQTVHFEFHVVTPDRRRRIEAGSSGDGMLTEGGEAGSYQLGESASFLVTGGLASVGRLRDEDLVVRFGESVHLLLYVRGASPPSRFTLIE
jgi:hypothetical protein